MPGVGLSCEGVCVRRDGRTILRAGALSIAAGETLVVLGPNGAGKTTLLGVLAGLDRADEGAARIGPDPADGLAARRRVALLPQRAPMLRGSVLDNAALPLRLRGVARGERETRAREALTQLGVASLADRAASTLSGGESRRVAIARALAARPEALLLDEPLEGVDPESRERLLADLLAAARAAGTTLVFVTHDRDEAVRAGGRIALLWDGELRSTGTLDELLRGATPEITRWLGESNLLPALVSESAPDGIEARVGAHRIRIAGTAPVPPVGASIRIVVPRESIEIRTGPPGPTSARNVLPARVVEIVPREGRTEVVLDAAGARLVAVVTRWAVEELALAPGREVQAVFKATACHWVAASG